jgi:hypothetical protein
MPLRLAAELVPAATGKLELNVSGIFQDGQEYQKYGGWFRRGKPRRIAKFKAGAQFASAGIFSNCLTRSSASRNRCR